MFKRMMRKHKLSNMFRTVDISHSITRNGNTSKYYPHLLEFKESEEEMTYVFRLPLGLDPDQLYKKEYAFKQYFGSHYELKGDGTIYSLRVFKRKMDASYAFSYDDLKGEVSKYKVPIVVGKDTNGTIHVYDMLPNPHLLIMGETGSGKSVMLRVIITFLSLCMRNRIEFILGDMKRTEFFLFRNVDNVKASVTNAKDLLKHLRNVRKELKRRGDLFDAHEVAHIDDYNELRKESLKYIMICIDEVALLKKEKDIMEIIEEISCIGRSLGVFLILSMQRGDAKILDGQLKNNLTSRAVFRCADKINSDIGLGKGSEYDASEILKSEKGKLFFKMEDIVKLQAPLLELEDAKKLLEPYKVQPIQKEDPQPTGADITPDTTTDTDDIATLPTLGGIKRESKG